MSAVAVGVSVMSAVAVAVGVSVMSAVAVAVGVSVVVGLCVIVVQLSLAVKVPVLHVAS